MCFRWPITQVQALKHAYETHGENVDEHPRSQSLFAQSISWRIFKLLSVCQSISFITCECRTLFTYMQVLMRYCSLWSCNEMLTVRPCLLPWTKDMVGLQELLTTFAASLVLSLLFHIPSTKGRMGDTDLILHLKIVLFVTVLWDWGKYISWGFGLEYDITCITTVREFPFEKHITYLLLCSRVYNTDELCLEIYILSL